jgi:hypothetical protein
MPQKKTGRRAKARSKRAQRMKRKQGKIVKR